MTESGRFTTMFLFLFLGISVPVLADDNTQNNSTSESGKASGWKDPKASPTPSADTSDRSRDRRSALEERVRYLEEQAAIMARDLEAERLRRAALETSAAAVKREAVELKAKVRGERQRPRVPTLAVEDKKPQVRTRQAMKALNGNKNIVRSSFNLPGALRPIKF